MGTHPARLLWQRLEAIHAVTYFAPECAEASNDLGLKGFWMGYFACRAAPMGAVAAGVVEATFANFAPSLVRRALPDAWSLATPAALVKARRTAAAAALRRSAPDLIDAAADLAIEPLSRIVAAAPTVARPLFAANRDLGLPDDPVEALWQLTTCIREQRGDGHVAVLAASGLAGAEIHLMFSAASGVPAERLRGARGWSAEEWLDASARLVRRGVLVAAAPVGTEPALTDAGRSLHAAIESTTDELAWNGLTAGSIEAGDVVGLAARLAPVAHAIAAAGDLTFPNPIGIPDPRG